jgi:hypothetical protein
MSAVRIDVAEAAALDARTLAGLCDNELEAIVVELAEARQVLEAAWLAALEAARSRSLHVRRGARDTATWIASLTGDRRGAARRDVAVAEQVAAAPVAAEALASGVVSRAQAAELARAADLPVDVQSSLVAQAGRIPVEVLAREVTRARLEHGAVDPVPAPSLSITATDFGAHVVADLDGEGSELVEKAVHVALDRLHLPTDLPYAQRRALGLVAVCRHFLEHVDEPGEARTGGRPHLLAVVDVATLVAEVGGSARLESGVLVRGEVARRLACDAGVSRVITNGRREVLDVGRTTRSIPPALARAVIVRDRHCTHPGCHAPPLGERDPPRPLGRRWPHLPRQPPAALLVPPPAGPRTRPAHRPTMRRVTAAPHTIVRRSLMTT